MVNRFSATVLCSLFAAIQPLVLVPTVRAQDSSVRELPAPKAMPAGGLLAEPRSMPSFAAALPNQFQPAATVTAMTLMEAIEQAMRNSKVVRVSSGTAVAADKATAYDIDIADSRIIAALAEFDTNLTSKFYTTAISKPPNAFFGPGLTEPILRDEGSLNLGFDKRWFTGAQTSINFNPEPAYLFIPNGTSSSSFNPTYVGELEFSLRQPLLRGRGRRVNKAPIEIRQIQLDQSSWDFKKAVMASMRSVAAAYWDLHAERVALRSLDEVLPLLEEIVRLQEENLKSEWVIRADVAKAYAQLYDFRQRRLAAQSAVVAAELRLKNLLYLPATDTWTITPVSEPLLQKLEIDGEQATHIAVDNQPDVVRLRLETKIREFELVLARNGRLPNLDFLALYRMNGVGDDVSNTLQQMFTADFSDWLLGFTFAVPVGNRQPRANLRAAELQFARTNELLYHQIAGVVYQVRDDIRELDYTFQQFREADYRRSASADWLAGARLRYENPLPGSENNWLLQSLNEYFFAVQSYTDATADAAKVLAKYNTAIFRLEETKGTLLEYMKFDLVGDPCRQSRILASIPASTALSSAIK